MFDLEFDIIKGNLMKDLLLVVVEGVFEVLFLFGELLWIIYLNQVAEVALDSFNYLQELIFMIFR